MATYLITATATTGNPARAAKFMKRTTAAKFADESPYFTARVVESPVEEFSSGAPIFIVTVDPKGETPENFLDSNARTFYSTEQAAKERAARMPGARVFPKTLSDGRVIWGIEMPAEPEPSRGDVFRRMRARQKLEDV